MDTARPIHNRTNADEAAITEHSSAATLVAEQAPTVTPYSAANVPEPVLSKISSAPVTSISDPASHPVSGHRHSASEKTSQPPADIAGSALASSRNGPPKPPLLKAIAGAMVMLLCLFWAASSYINGKIYKESDYAYRLHVLVVDMDGGDIGEILFRTTDSLKGVKGQPTYNTIPYTLTTAGGGDISYDSVYDRVRAGEEVWGAILAMNGASQRLQDAVSNGTQYNSSSALTFVYNESRYRMVADSLLFPNMASIAAQAGARYRQTYSIEAIRMLPADNFSNRAEPLMEPIGFTVDKIAPFGFNASFLTNTIMFVFPNLSQFFLIMAMNGILGGAGAYGKWSLKANLLIRFLFGTLHPMLIGLSWAGWLYIFKNSVHIGTVQFFQIWCVFWLFATINFHLIDGICALVDVKWIPFFIFSWILSQIATVVIPHELSSVFYRVDYFFPSYHVWGLFMTIVAHGANSHLKINLTVLFMWLVVVLPWGVFGNYTRWKRVHRAMGTATH
ncbi:hypothetical protein BDZ91DRAFT_751867 [Kalaharituber pfeilii]|nr:hypothetical protein BDZ91DRAFT_751867 [Kalaharituber pfeilii]